MKKDLSEVIVSLEELTKVIGENIGNLFKKLYEETKQKEYLEIAKKYFQTQKRTKAYEKYLDKDLLKLVDALEKNEQDIPSYLKEFSSIFKRIKIIEKELNSQIRNSILFLVVLVALGYVMTNKFASISSQMLSSLNMVNVSNITASLASAYKIVAPSILSFYILFFVIFRNINPIFRKIKMYLNSIKILLILKIGLSSGLSPKEIAKLIEMSCFILIKEKNLDTRKIIINIKKYLEEIERISILLALEGGVGKVKEVLEFLLEKKIKELEAKKETFKNQIGFIFKVGQIILILFIIASYLSFMYLSIKVNSTIMNMVK